jgi:hypothetical protein
MKWMLLPILMLGASSLAFAQPVQLTVDEMDTVTAGGGTKYKKVPLVINPAGKAPPGQQIHRGGPKGKAMKVIWVSKSYYYKALPGHKW